jgi:hypothetical protein
VPAVGAWSCCRHPGVRTSAQCTIAVVSICSKVPALEVADLQPLASEQRKQLVAVHQRASAWRMRRRGRPIRVA